MITDAFDSTSEEIIKVTRGENAVKVDACILTFSHNIRQYVVDNFDCRLIGNLYSANGASPMYAFDYKGHTFAFYMSFIGAPACVADMEDTLSLIDTDKYIVFGGAGCLNKEIARGKVMVPTEAYRDEGTSYHYAPAADYITIKNSERVAAFMEESGLPYVLGRTWTADAFHRETRNEFSRHKDDGCISVEMECAGVQAMCDFRGLNPYFFFTAGDLLDAPKWETRMNEGQIKRTHHDPGHFEIALELAAYISE